MSFKNFRDDDLNLKEPIENLGKHAFNEMKESIDINNFDIETLIEIFREKIEDSFKNKFINLKKAVNEIGGWKELFKIIWNLEEESIDILTFEHILSWAKANFEIYKHSAACLVMSKKGKEFNLLFLDKKNRPLLGGSEKHKVFYVNGIDDDLKIQLGNKSMLILK